MNLRLNKTYIQTIRNPVSFKDRKWTYETERREVTLMAIVKNYAMVRRKSCMPYVVSVKELSEVTE